MGTYGPFSSLVNYTRDPVVLITVMSLIVIGGLGFFVWEDIYRAKRFKKFSRYTKMVLVITGILIVGGASFFFFVEYHNPATMGNMGVGEKILNSFFQSVTARTAGFNTINEGGLTDGSLALTTILMLIGGSSGSTAGGIKTVTAGVLFLVIWAGIRGREDVTIRGRSISKQQVLNVMTLSVTVLFVFLFSSLTITVIEKIPYLHAAFEVASAMGTVGLTVGITPGLSVFSHLIIILLMYTGRVGMLSFSIAYLVRNRYPNKIQYPTFNIMVG
ncbi:Ktr system potassium uptake protein B [bioreactor metagenome]|uniref:Ktr system potassium uptake protein B n=1 Tax=bioreactor metagenome TaxID=1076179 RepID=A0A644XYP4_9ZZZZ